MCQIKLVVVLCLHMSTIYSAPMMQMMPYQRILMQQQQQNLQQQLIELQALTQLNNLPAPNTLNNPVQPILFFIPDDLTNMVKNEKQITNNRIDDEIKLRDSTKPKDDSDSIVVDAEPLPILEDQKAVLLFPNGRMSIGGIISAIPFLPIEINVPDTISWAYNGIANGIAGIISIIGQRLPFRRPATPLSSESLQTINNIRVQNTNDMNANENAKPIVVIPLGGYSKIMPVQF